MNAPERHKAAYPYLKAWLWGLAALVLAMVLLGGATRLTDSGLSITEWQLVSGIVPPLSQADWQEAFAKYQQIPEYQVLNRGMSLEEFKTIFWWEWSHRILGRLIGVVFVVPFLVFLALRRIEARLVPSLLAILVLGALQGVLGWYMVKSGLAVRTDVSQYRLAAHLTLAAFVLAAIVWTILGIGTARGRPRGWQDWQAIALVLLLFLQIAMGGFVAGLDAGQGYATWPLMDGQLVPSGLLIMEPAWRNLFENAMTVQFVHRLLAYAIVLLMALHAWSSFTARAWVMVYVTILQIVLGVWTLLWHVPLPLALLHQFAAMALLCLAVWNLSGLLAIRRPEAADEGRDVYLTPTKA